MEKHLKASRKCVIEDMTTTSITDAVSEGGLHEFEAMLTAFRAGDQCEAGRVLFGMIDSFLEAEINERAQNAADHDEQRRAA
jgi:hypothetical protein